MTKIITNQYTIEEYSINTHKYNSGVKGKNLLIFGSIHGNETCGPDAIKLIINEIKQGLLEIVSGSITFIPIANPAAYINNTRKLNVDLGRNFDISLLVDDYEKQVVTILQKYIDESDYFLDIHSMSAKSKPCVFQDWPDINTQNFASSLGIEDILIGWPELYEDNNSPDANMYAHKKGKIGVLIECGSHLDSSATGVAKKSIKNALLYTGITKNITQEERINQNFIHMKKLYNKEFDGEMIKEWSHGETIKKGDIIAKYSNNTELKAPSDGYIILPKAHAKIGDEWFYFGVNANN